MDYGALVNRSLRTMWNHKYLWLLGFLASLGEGGGQAFWNVGKKSNVMNGLISQPGVLAFLALLGFFLFIIFVIARYIAHGGLIHCVNRISHSELTSLGDGWKAGVKNFWRLLGIGILILLMIIAALIVCGLPVLVAFLAHKALGIASLLFFVPLFLFLFVIILFVDSYADRACVIEGKGVFDSLKEGWDTFKDNLGRSIAVALISFISSILFAIPFILVGLGLVANFFLAWAFAGIIFAIILGVLIAFIYVVITEGLFNTYLSSFWTLAYLEIRKTSQKSALSSI